MQPPLRFCTEIGAESSMNVLIGYDSREGDVGLTRV